MTSARVQAFSVVTLCNAGVLDPRKFGQEVADLYLEAFMRPSGPRPQAPAAVAVSTTELARYVGVYAADDNDWNPLTIELRNGKLGEVLFHDVLDDSLFTMTPAGDGRFFEIGLTGNVGILSFRSPAPGAPLNLEISWNGGPAETLWRVAESALWRPTARALKEYTGTWFSDELDTGWHLHVRGEQLVLSRTGQRDLSLRPIERDKFIRGFGPWVNEFTAQIHFHRDGAGNITHLTVSTPPGEDSVRDLRFVRVSRQ